MQQKISDLFNPHLQNHIKEMKVKHISNYKRSLSEPPTAQTLTANMTKIESNDQI